MPFALVDILEQFSGNRKEAAAHCLCIATNFPAYRAEYEWYARILLRQV